MKARKQVRATRASKRRQQPLSAVERDLIEGFDDLLGKLRRGEPLTVRRFRLDMRTQTYDAGKVKQTRDMLGLSQPLFAAFLGVSPKTVAAWEAGKQPSEMAARFLDEIQRSPDYWRGRVAESMQPA